MTRVPPLSLQEEFVPFATGIFDVRGGTGRVAPTRFARRLRAREELGV